MPEHLDPSSLGTKSHWDEAYTVELQNHASQPSDEGTIWFADASAEERMLSHLRALADGGELAADGDASSFLDLGTGNGHLIFSLVEEGWTGRKVGVDYSETGVRLCRTIRETRAREAAEEEGEQEDGAEMAQAYRECDFEVWDLLRDSPRDEWLQDGFDVVLDKGTFDAISLSAETDDRGRRVVEGYRERVEPLVKEGGRFLITSCNWTNDEIKGWFTGEGSSFEFESEVEYPRFTFGGKTGQQVCTICFRKRRNP